MAPVLAYKVAVPQAIRDSFLSDGLKRIPGDQSGSALDLETMDARN